MKRVISNIFGFLTLLLLLIVVVGLCLQVFLPDGHKITDLLENRTLAVGDEITVLYVKPDVEEKYPELRYALANLDWTDATTFGGGAEQRLPLVVFECKDAAVEKIYLYAVRTKSYGNYNTSGWASYGLWVSQNWNILNYGNGKSDYEFNPTPLTVVEVYQQEVWRDVVSKKPF